MGKENRRVEGWKEGGIGGWEGLRMKGVSDKLGRRMAGCENRRIDEIGWIGVWFHRQSGMCGLNVDLWDKKSRRIGE